MAYSSGDDGKPRSNGFNPAFFVSYDADGRRYIDLASQNLWLAAKYPGFRVVSDGFDVFTHEMVNERGEKQLETILVGHVAILDGEGVKYLSVPASVSVNETGGDCAFEFFEKGAAMALDMLGLVPNNITESQWRELDGVRRIIEDENEVSREESGEEPEFDVRSVSVSELAEKGVDDDELLLAAHELFKDYLVFYGEEIDSYRKGEKVNLQRLKELFDIYCRMKAGTSWSVLSSAGQRNLVQKLERKMKEAVK